MQRVYDFLKEAKTYYLATGEGNEPRVRPFGTVDVFDGKLCIQTGKVKSVSRQLHINPKAEICAFLNGSWIRVSGEMAELDSVDARKHMLDAYPELRSMYSEDDGNTEIWYFTSARAVIASFTAPPVVITF